MFLHEPTPGAAWMVERCEMPNSRSCDGFSGRLQIVLFTMGDPVLNPVYNANADVWHVPREILSNIACSQYFYCVSDGHTAV